jgi:phosphatidylserine decarboxylase
MNWDYGIHQCQKTLPGKTCNDVLSLINTACQTPPSFSNSDLVGFPINAIFVEFMQNENGRAFFSDHRVNSRLKEILDTYQQMLLSPISLEHMNEGSPEGWFCP